MGPLDPLKQAHAPPSQLPLPASAGKMSSPAISDPLAVMNQSSPESGQTELIGRVSKERVESAGQPAPAKEAVTSEMWECVARIPNKLGGFCYEFKLKDEYNSTAKRSQLLVLKDEIKKMETEWKRGGLTEPADIEKLKSKRMEHAELVKLVHSPLDEMVHDKRNAIFPAIEPGGYGLFTPSAFAGPSLLIFTMLGYKQHTGRQDSSIRFTIPDKEALDANWEELRRVYGKDIIPPLNIVGSDGIADDKSFVEAHLHYDGLLSSGKELVHDHFAHIIPTIQQLLRGVLNPQLKNQGDPLKEREGLTKIFAKGYQNLQTAEKQIKALEDEEKARRENPDSAKKFPPDVEAKIAEVIPKLPAIKKHMDKMWAGLGSYVDVGTNAFDFTLRNGEKGLSDHMYNIWDDLKWRHYWFNRFGREEMRGNEIRTAWRELEALEWIHNRISNVPNQ